MKSVEHTYESNGINGNLRRNERNRDRAICGDASVYVVLNERHIQNSTNTCSRCRRRRTYEFKYDHTASKRDHRYTQAEWMEPDREVGRPGGGREREGDDDGNGK